MDTKGFVYVMTNPSMPGLVKVGMTHRVPTKRTYDDDMTSTGVPKQFQVQYYAFFDDMFKAERKAHQKLKDYHYGKEFFKADVATAIVAIESIDIPFTKLFSKPDDDRKAEEIRLAELKAEEEKREKEREREHPERVGTKSIEDTIHEILSGAKYDEPKRLDEETKKVIESGPISLKHVIYAMLLIAAGISLSIQNQTPFLFILFGLLAVCFLIYGFISRGREKKRATER